MNDRYVQVHEYVYDRELRRRAGFTSPSNAATAAGLMNKKPENTDDWRWEETE